MYISKVEALGIRGPPVRCEDSAKVRARQKREEIENITAYKKGMQGQK